ncbi:hypothetical protein ACO0LC_21370 [Undibacterium sp. JH2W]|uniref:hypothetical protein n=1 Tax=Undibacterium sp. JH2W TaxID=3413037 RepID=UPI003BF1FAB8
MRKVKTLSKLGGCKEQSIHLQFPFLQNVKENINHGEMGQVALSVFDHWITCESEYHLLDNIGVIEQENRNQKFLSHWAAIFDATEIFTLRYRGRWPKKERLVIKQYADKAGYLAQCRLKMGNSPFQFLILPEFDCLYMASWDDTNHLYFNDRLRAEPILSLAKKSGLHILEYN